MDITRAYYVTINEEKKDLVTLLALIPETFYDFYKNLKSNKDTIDPIISDEENQTINDETTV